MSTIYIEHVFNPYFEAFLHTYGTAFPMLTHFNQVFRPSFAPQLTKPTETFIRLVYNSCKPLETHLHNKDDKFIFGEGNLFVRHLQLRNVWPKLPDHQKELLWGFLIGTFLLSQGIEQLSSKTLALLGQYYLDHKDKEPSGLGEVQTALRELANQVDPKEVSMLGAFVTDLSIHEHTPIYFFIPQNFHAVTAFALKLFKHPDQQKQLSKLFIPRHSAGEFKEEDIQDKKKVKSVIDEAFTQMQSLSTKLGPDALKDPQAALMSFLAPSTQRRHGIELAMELEEDSDEPEGPLEPVDVGQL